MHYNASGTAAYRASPLRDQTDPSKPRIFLTGLAVLPTMAANMSSTLNPANAPETRRSKFDLDSVCRNGLGEN